MMQCVYATYNPVRKKHYHFLADCSHDMMIQLHSRISLFMDSTGEFNYVYIDRWTRNTPCEMYSWLNIAVSVYNTYVDIEITNPENFLQNIDKILATRAPTLPDVDTLLKFLRGDE